jgi:hypothetical protein
MLKAIHAGENIVSAREKAVRVIEKPRPEEHWRRIRINNPLERPPARDQTAHARRGRVPRRAIGAQPRRR